jgi:hypothetical protein
MKQTHWYEVRHKIINDKPFLELTIYEGSQAMDKNTWAKNEWDVMNVIIYQWMYNDN